MTIPADQAPSPVVDAQRIISVLVSERQALRSTGAPEAWLEANRLALVYWQERLSRALVAANARPEGPS